MPNFTVTKRFLTKRNEEEHRAVFRQCFPESWRTSVPYPRDPIYAATAADGTVIGFCMVHDCPPEKMKQGPGGYMYNLCVAPAYRRQGVGSAIVNAVIQDNPQCYTHMEIAADASNNAFMTRLGWVRTGTSRHYYEWVHFANPAEAQQATPCEPALWNPQQYDARNNVIYVDAHLD